MTRILDAGNAIRLMGRQVPLTVIDGTTRLACHQDMQHLKRLIIPVVSG